MLSKCIINCKNKQNRVCPKYKGRGWGAMRGGGKKVANELEVRIFWEY